MRVLENREETPGVWRLSLARSAEWRHGPGQVAELARGPGTEGYFAIASGPDEAALTFLVKPAGTPSGAVAEARPGELVDVRGPFGAGFDLPADRSERLVFVGAGTALAALRSALVAALAAGVEADRVVIVCGVRRPRDLAFRAELEALVARGLDLRIVVSRPEPEDGWSGRTGWVQGALADLARPVDGSWPRFFVAGSDALEDAVAAALAEAGVPREHVQHNYRPDWRS